MVVGTALFVVAVLIIAVYVFIELKRFQHKLFAIVVIALILFTYLSASVIFKDKGLDFSSPEGMIEGTKVYFSWLGSLFGNFRSITSHAIQMDWGANETE